MLTIPFLRDKAQTAMRSPINLSQHHRRWRGLRLLALFLTCMLSLGLIQPALAAFVWQVQIVDSAGGVGKYTALALDSSGYPVISYYDEANRDLKLVHCGDATCNSGNTVRTVDSAGAVGEYTSLALDSSGNPIISYHDAGNGNLKLAHCGDTTCGSGNTISIVDSAGQVGWYTSLALDSSGNPVISYFDLGNGNLKVAHCGNAACSSGNTINTVDNSAGDVGRYNSLALDSSGRPVISYYDASNGRLKLVRCGDTICGSGNTTSIVDSSGQPGWYTSLALDSSGYPVISYWDGASGHLRVAHCGDATCSSGATIQTVDSAGIVGQYNSLRLDSSGRPVISYRDTSNGRLKLVQCGNATCSSGNTIQIADGAGSVGWYSSLALDGSGQPVISYYDASNGDLRVARLVNDCQFAVSNESELNAALACANAANGGTETITLRNDITLSAATTTLNNPNGASLILEGNGFSINGNGHGPIFTIFPNGTVTMRHLTIQQGQATSGAGINNSGHLTLVESTVSGNTATGTAGGGILNAGTLSLIRSTVSGNRAPAAAGIFNLSGAVLTLENSTLSGNTATAGGAGALWQQSGAQATLRYSTLSDNQGLIYGGLFNEGGLTLHATIIANHGNGDCTSANGGVATDQGYNLVEDGGCLASPTSRNGDPRLAPLANNGGPGGRPPFTHALLPGSPALNVIPTALCQLTRDQRNVTRPQGTACDSGAFEAQSTVWQNQTVDSDGDVGQNNSHKLDSNDKPVVTYRDATNYDKPKLTKCTDSSCNGVKNSNTVDNNGGDQPKLGLDSNDKPVISYHDKTNGDLKVTKCGDGVCGSGNTTHTVDNSNNDVGQDHSLKLDSNDKPVISYHDETNGDLKLAHCGDATCSSGNTIQLVDSDNDVGEDTSLALDSNGHPVISYYDATNGDLKLVHCGDTTCSSGNTIVTVDSAGDVGQESSLALDANGYPVISYYDATNGDLKVVHCGDATCSSGNSIVTVDNTGDVGRFTSLVLNSSGYPVISYYDVTNGNLKVVQCGDATCSNGNLIETVDSNGDVGQSTSLTLDSNGNPVITYYDATNGDLKLVRLTSDAIPPLITAALSPATSDGQNGWYVSDITVSFTCADEADGSGLATNTVAGATLGADGANQAVTNSGQCSDNAGNGAAPVTVSGLNLDKTPPSISAAATSAPNANGWYNNDVVIHFTCTDGLAGVASCPPDQGLSSEGTAVASTAQTSSDLAGNSSAPSNVVTVQLDKTPPLVAVTGVSNGAQYPLGSVPVAGCTTDDLLSGVNTPALLTLSSGNADGTGSYTATCSGALDRAGNTASATVSYQVLYLWTNFFQPVDNLPTVNSVNAGVAIPVRFGLGGDYGLSIFASGYPASQNVSCGSGGSGSSDPIEETTTAGNSSLHYDAATQTYSYIWKTDKAWAGTCRLLLVRFIDGAEYSALFQFNGKMRSADAGEEAVVQQIFLPLVNR
jgi:hypothetical protein